MSIKVSIYKETLREYENLKNHAEARRRKLKSDVFAKLPRLSEIENEVNLTGIKMAKLVLFKPENTAEAVESLKSTLACLKNEKLALLESLNLKEAYLDDVYICSKCKDTGFIETKECTCFRQKLIDKAYGQSNLNDIVKVENFDNFDIGFYSKAADPTIGRSPYSNIVRIFQNCTRFTEMFDFEYKNLLIYGETGLGKTFLCNCIARELLDRGKTVIYLSANQLFKMIEDDKFNREPDAEPSHFMDDILSVDLFIIDDLGTEFSTILSNSQFFNIINTRMLTKKPIIISTNLNPNQIKDQYSDRIVSRLAGSFEFMNIIGDDIRLQKFRNHLGD